MRTHSKTPLFLMELVSMLLFFAFSAVICLQIFTEAREISEKSRRMDYALLEGQRVAEYWKETQGDLEKMAEQLDGIVQGNDLFIFYDETWISQPKESVFTLSLSHRGPRATICISEGKEEVLSFSCEAVMYHG